jgi:predicted transcriptional regulator
MIKDYSITIPPQSRASTSSMIQLTSSRSLSSTTLSVVGPTSTNFDTLVHARPKKPVRSQNTIVRAILDACRTPAVQHWIMVRARLGYDTFWHHMNDLLSRGMLESVNDGSKTLYRINAKGLDLLDSLESA